MLGRFMRANKQEYPCKLRDISVGGVALMTPVDVEAGERIVAYFDQFGGIEGTVARTFEGGFAIRLTATQHKREKLAAQIMWLINRHELSSAEDRRHERIPIGSKLTSLKLAEGIVVDVRVVDISLSGASISTTARPAGGRVVARQTPRSRYAPPRQRHWRPIHRHPGTGSPPAILRLRKSP